AERADGALHERGDLGLVGHGARDAEGLVTGGGQLGGGGDDGVLVEVGEHDRGAGRCEALGGGQAHPAAGAGDHGDLATEVIGRVHVHAPVASRFVTSVGVTGAE